MSRTNRTLKERWGAFWLFQQRDDPIGLNPVLLGGRSEWDGETAPKESFSFIS